MGKRKQMRTRKDNTARSNEEIEKYFDGLLEWMEADDKNIFVKDYFNKERVQEKVIHKWIIEMPWLEEKYEIAKSIQEVKLLNQGLHKQLDSALTKFVLSAHHDYKEKTENTNTNVNADVKLKDLVSFEKNDKKKKKK